MGKGPSTIYKECTTKAINYDKNLALNANVKDVVREINEKYGYASLLELDVKRAFFENNYGTKKTDKALGQWMDLSLVGRVYYNGYWALLFLDHPTRIKGATE